MTAFGKIADLSPGQPPNCTKILYLKAFPGILVWHDPWFCQIACVFLPSHTRPPSGSW